MFEGLGGWHLICIPGKSRLTGLGSSFPQLSTQFWDTYTGFESEGQLLPKNSWTLHGLWPDFCDGEHRLSLLVSSCSQGLPAKLTLMPRLIHAVLRPEVGLHRPSRAHIHNTSERHHQQII